MSWFRLAADGSVLLNLHIQPGAKKTEVAGLHGDALKIRLAAPPVDGKANQELLRYMAGILGVPKNAVTLKSGRASRQKVVLVRKASADMLNQLLEGEGST